MSRLVRFALEDFLDDFEHRSGLINLATSDSEPWRFEEVRTQLGDWTTVLPTTLAYPDLKAELNPALERAFQVPEGWALPTNGAEESIAMVMHYVAARSTKMVGLPTPAYGAFHGWVKLLNLPFKTYSYLPEQGWQPELNELCDLARQCDTLVVINPHNPVGHHFCAADLRTLADILARHDGLLIVDEVFATHRGGTSPVQYTHRNALIIGSLSKMYGLPGLRLGWVLADRRHLKQLRTVQHYLTLSPSLFAASIGPLVLDRLEEFTREKMVAENRETLAKWAGDQSDLLSVSPPNGGTTVVLEVKDSRGEQQVFDLLFATDVLLSPGRFFELPTHPARFRLGYGQRPDILMSGLGRIAKTLSTS
jgi:aspartate/methionine/tyrosine aminotransferase